MEDNATNNVVNLFPNTQEQLSPEELALHQQITGIYDEQSSFIQSMVMDVTSHVDEMAIKKTEEEPDFQLLVHMPVEAFFTSAATFIHELLPQTPEFQAVYPKLIEELTASLRTTVDEFYEKNGQSLPAELMHYGYLNAAIMSLQEQRVMYAYHQATGEPIDHSVSVDNGGTDNDKN